MPEKIYAVGDVPTTDALVTENESVLDRHLTVAKIGSLLDMERSSQCRMCRRAMPSEAIMNYGYAALRPIGVCEYADRWLQASPD